jgi:hypothetical protein
MFGTEHSLRACSRPRDLKEPVYGTSSETPSSEPPVGGFADLGRAIWKLSMHDARISRAGEALCLAVSEQVGWQPITRADANDAEARPNTLAGSVCRVSSSTSARRVAIRCGSAICCRHSLQARQGSLCRSNSRSNSRNRVTKNPKRGQHPSCSCCRRYQPRSGPTSRPYVEA